jgi:protease I
MASTQLQGQTVAEALRDRKLTSWASLKTDVRNVGGEWVEQEVVVDRSIASSCKPGDQPAFCAKLIEGFAEARHDVAHADATAQAD